MEDERVKVMKKKATVNNSYDDDDDDSISLIANGSILGVLVSSVNVRLMVLNILYCHVSKTGCFKSDWSDVAGCKKSKNSVVTVLVG